MWWPGGLALYEVTLIYRFFCGKGKKSDGEGFVSPKKGVLKWLFPKPQRMKHSAGRGASANALARNTTIWVGVPKPSPVMVEDGRPITKPPNHRAAEMSFLTARFSVSVATS